MSSWTPLNLITSWPKSYLIGSLAISHSLAVDEEANVLSPQGIALTEIVHESSEFALAEHLETYGLVHTANTSRDSDGDFMIAAVRRHLVNGCGDVCVCGRRLGLSFGDESVVGHDVYGVQDPAV